MNKKRAMMPLTDERIYQFTRVRIIATGEGGVVMRINEDLDEPKPYYVKVWLDPAGTEWEYRDYRADELSL